MKQIKADLCSKKKKKKKKTKTKKTHTQQNYGNPPIGIPLPTYVFTIFYGETWWYTLFVCIEILRPSQLNGVMSSAVSLPNHTFTGQA